MDQFGEWWSLPAWFSINLLLRPLMRLLNQYKHIRRHSHILMFVQFKERTHTHSHTHMHTHKHTQVHTHTYTHAHTHIHTHIVTTTHSHTHCHTHRSCVNSSCSGSSFLWRAAAWGRSCCSGCCTVCCNCCSGNRWAHFISQRFFQPTQRKGCCLCYQMCNLHTGATAKSDPSLI